MSATSIIGGVVAKFPTLAIAPAAKLYFTQIPLRDASGSPVSLPYVVLLDNGTTPEYDLEYNPVEVTRFEFHVYATTLADADTIAAGIRYGGAGVAAGLGYDFGSLDLSGLRLLQVVRESERRFMEGDRGGSGLPVHRVVMGYSATAQRTA